MSSPALATRPLSPALVDATIERYVTASRARLDRLLAAAELAEPLIKDADRAVKAIDPLIETLTGLAIGRVIGAVMHGVRRTFAPATNARVQTAMTGALRTLAPPDALRTLAPPDALRTLAPPDAPALFVLDGSPCCAFGHELRQRMRRRLALAPRDAHAVIAAMARALESDELAPFVRMLSLLADDPMLGDRFAPQLAIGWRCYVAVVEGTTCDPGDAMWARWLRKVRGEPEPMPAPTRTQLAAAGFLVQVA